METNKIDIEFFKLAIQARDLELKLFWQRSLFFGSFIAAIFIGYYTLLSSSCNDDSFFLRSILVVVGVLFSLAWSLANRGSKYWYESWEQKVNKCEKELKKNLFREWIKPQEKCWVYQARLYSVSKIAIFLSDLVVMAWLFMLVYHFKREVLLSLSCGCFFLISVLIVSTLLFLLFVGTRTSVPKEIKKKWKEEDM